MTGAILAACAALLAPPPAPAGAFCLCDLGPSEEEAFRNSQLVFTGRALEAHLERGDGDVEYVTYTVVVDRWRKGEGGDTVEVRAAVVGSTCGTALPLRRRITLYGRRSGDRVVIDPCSLPLRMRQALGRVRFPELRYRDNPRPAVLPTTNLSRYGGGGRPKPAGGGLPAPGQSPPPVPISSFISSEKPR